MNHSTNFCTLDTLTHKRSVSKVERQTWIACGSHHQVTTKFNCLEVLQKRHCIWTPIHHILHFFPKLKRSLEKWRTAICFQLFTKKPPFRTGAGVPAGSYLYLSVVQPAMKICRTPEKTSKLKTKPKRLLNNQKNFYIYLIRCTWTVIIK